MNDEKPQEETVAIEMSEEALKTIESVMPPEPSMPEHTIPYQLDEKGKAQCKLCNMILSGETEAKEHIEKAHPVIVDEEKPPEPPKDPNRNEKGQFVQGNVGGGTPCGFCKNNPEEILKKIELYFHWTTGKIDHKEHIPFIEELCGYEYLDMLVQTLEDWCRNDKPMDHDPNHKPELHSRLSQSIKRILQRQKFFLLRGSLRPQGQVAGMIFQLKANHGMIETEKRMLVGGKEGDDPIKEYIVTEERKIPEDD